MTSRNGVTTPPEALSRPAPEDVYVIVAKGGQEYITTNSLVLSATGIDHRIDLAEGVLLVDETHSTRAIDELRAFTEENRDWPPLPNYARPVQRSDNPPTLLMMGSLILFYTVTGPWLPTNSWFQAGAIDSTAIVHGHNWWRLFTALTLHADQVHLVGNCVIGGFMVHLLSTTTGYGTAWLGLILAAGFGNWLNVVLREGPHYAVGFSTAVFAAIGIMCGLQMGSSRFSILKQLLLSLGAGTGLLAMLGSEGKQTDLGAHFFGLGCGIIFGMLIKLSTLDQQTGNTKLQHSLYLVSLFLIIGSWLLATHFS